MTQNNDTVTANADELRNYVERLEKIVADKKSSNAEYNEMYTDVINEAKGRGYDIKALKEVIKIRAQDPDDLAEFRGILDVYCSSLGIEA